MSVSPIEIAVPRPCPQPWQAMTPNQRGRFCAHCQKTVVDFTTMTDAQVLAYLRTTGGSGCGRFRTDQLNRVLTRPVIGKPGRWQWMSVLLSGWLSSQAVQAQTGNTSDRQRGGTFVPALTRSADNHNRVDTAAQGLMPDGTMLLKGRVIDAVSRQPIRGAAVTIGQAMHVTTTDSAGAFRLTTPVVPSDSTVQLVASLIGYINQTLPVTMYIAGQPLLIELHEDTEALTDMVYVGEYVVEKPTLWRRIRNKLKRN